MKVIGNSLMHNKKTVFVITNKNVGLDLSQTSAPISADTKLKNTLFFIEHLTQYKQVRKKEPVFKGFAKLRPKA